MTDNNDPTAPEMIDGAHIGSAEEQTDEQSSSSTTTSTTAITGQTAGVDEPDPSLRDDDELDALGGDEPTTPTSEEATEATENASNEPEIPDSVDWLLPDETDESGRTGVLSNRSEVIAVAVGITAGGHFGLSGDVQLINDVVGIGLLGDRARRANSFPQTHIDQAKEELPHFLAGVVVGYAATKTDILSEIGTSVGW